eukprot:2170900-Amphidinium_carterae.1
MGTRVQGGTIAPPRRHFKEEKRVPPRITHTKAALNPKALTPDQESSTGKRMFKCILEKMQHR